MCLVNVIKEGLVTFSGNSILVMQRLGNVCLGTVTIIRLMSPILNIDFGGMDISYECCPANSTSYIIFRRRDWLEKVKIL